MISQSREWGGSNATEESMTNSILVNVSPFVTSTTTMYLDETLYVVPFMYTERIVLPDGTTRIHKDQEGVYRNLVSTRRDDIQEVRLDRPGALRRLWRRVKKRAKKTLRIKTGEKEKREAPSP